MGWDGRGWERRTYAYGGVEREIERVERKVGMGMGMGWGGLEERMAMVWLLQAGRQTGYRGREGEGDREKGDRQIERESFLLIDQVEFD